MNEPNETAANLMTLSERLAPMVDWAEGQKAMMVERGWSIGAAEKYALALLVEMTGTMFGQIPKR